MKKILIPISFLCSSVLIAQGVLTKNIITFNTIEKNEKTILFSKKTTINNINYIVEAVNETSKDFNKCKWVSSLSSEKLKYFTIQLEKIKQGEKIETNFFTLKAKNGRVYVYFNDTKCTSEHKTHYFQKSCNRELSFIVQQNQIKELTTALIKDVQQDLLVNNSNP